MQIETAVALLLKAEAEKKPIDQLTKRINDISVDQAYKIQLGYVEKRKADGAEIVGKKIGLTSKAMQEMLQVDKPDYGHLFDDMMYKNDTVISIDRFIQPKVEFEIAFVLKRDLKGPGITEADVIDAVDYVVPAFEIIDSRIKDWEIKFEDTVADNGSSAGAILGEQKAQLDVVDLPNVEMTVYRNGEFLDQAKGAAVMGNPLTAVTWLANAIGVYDISLKQGEVILAGALSKAIPIENDDQFTATFTDLGSVSATFKK